MCDDARRPYGPALHHRKTREGQERERETERENRSGVKGMI